MIPTIPRRRTAPTIGSFIPTPDATLNKLQQMEEMVQNLSLRSRQWLWDLLDPRRDTDDEAGYPRIGESIPAETYRLLYGREAIANRVVEVMPKESWQVSPNVYEDEDSESETQFEKDFDEIGQTLTGEALSWHSDDRGSGLWPYLLRLDIMSGIGQFGIMLLGVNDGLDLSLPVEGSTIVVNRRREPVYKNVPLRRDNIIRNRNGSVKKIKRGQLVRNEDGTVKKVRKQVGWRYVVQSRQQVVDSPITEGEEKYLLNGAWQKLEKQWNPVTGKSDATVERLPLTDNEKKKISEWARERKAYEEAVANAQRNPPKPEAGFALDNTPSSRGKTIQRTDSTMQGSLVDPYSGAQIKDFQPTSEIGYGAERSHQFPTKEEMVPALMPGQLSGTDQQYFGVQFGPSEALSPKPVKKGLQLKFIRVFDESLVQVVRYEWNIRNPRFGKPVMYRVTLNDPRSQHSGVGLPLATVFVHWTRVIHACDNLLSSEIFGVPRLQPVLNNILGLRKLYAGAPEMYWRGAFPGISLETHPQLGGDVDVDTAANQAQMEQYFNGLQRYMELMGMSAKTLAPTVVDPTPNINIQLEAISIQIGCPMRVFKGSERGELASSQDDEKWNDRVMHRNNFHRTPRLVVPLVDRLILFGILTEPETFTVEWPLLDSLGKKDKAAIALQLMQAINTYSTGGADAFLPPADMYVRFLGFTEEEANEMLQSAAKAREKALQQGQDQADEQGLEQAPPPGFQKPAPDPSDMQDDQEDQDQDDSTDSEQDTDSEDAEGATSDETQ